VFVGVLAATILVALGRAVVGAWPVWQRDAPELGRPRRPSSV